MADDEYAALLQSADRDGLTASEWVRQTVRAAHRARSTGDPARKLAALREAARHEFPTADIDQMLAEIERGALA